MRLIFKDPRLRSQMLHLFIPFFLQELVVALTILMSNLVLGWWGCEEAVRTGIANASQIIFVYNAIAVSFCFVGSLFISQHYGRGGIDEVQRDYYILLKAAFILGIIFFVLALAIPEYLFFFVKDPNSKQYAVEYIRWFSPVFLLISPNVINYVLMKNMRLEKFGTISSAITFVLVLSFESASIFSLDAAHHDWAIECAALSMVLARLIEFIFLFVIINKKCFVKLKIREFFKSDFNRFKAMVRYGSPMVVSKISWSIGFIMVTIISNNFQTMETAKGLFEAHSCMIIYQNIVTCCCDALSGVVGVLIGRELGANRLKKAEDHANDIMRLIPLAGLVEGVALMIFLPIAIASTPNLDANAKAFLWKVFLIQAVVFLPRSYNSTICNGMLNAGGDTLFILLIDGITAWVTIVPLGYIGLHLNWNPLLIYALLELEEFFKCPFFFIRYRKKKWVFNITQKKGIVFNE